MTTHYFKLEGEQLEKSSQLNPYESPTNIVPAIMKHNLRKIANLGVKQGGHKQGEHKDIKEMPLMTIRPKSSSK